ncbi:hypothetical protein [Parasporobacterium paucivorans]|uniref:PQ loop repeat-containing protein n=1 Tax=Parasporobacterium paucivorans DSM 15970 TaxID=1122934 RepID=A0A1M6ITZ6_9FIRM|nr:hypothetical protein [Parasporobacterium paucivorans]SHJ37884.1 hypothetical protein SAMN02745691_01852 [Parasporobacterium paucivorans DSM 15970]
MAEIFEMLMVICFGISWPLSIYKSLKSRTAKGKSLTFECFILIGYVFGIISKLTQSSISYVLIFYVINFISVSIDIGLYFRNARLDRLAE